MRAMRALAERPLPEDLLTTYKRYERGKNFPTTYATLLAAVFSTDTESLFGNRSRAPQVVRSTTPSGVGGAEQAASVVQPDAPADRRPEVLTGRTVAGVPTSRQRVLVTSGSGVIAGHCVVPLDQGSQVRTTVGPLAPEVTMRIELIDADMNCGDALTFVNCDVLLHVACPEPLTVSERARLRELERENQELRVRCGVA